MEAPNNEAAEAAHWEVHGMVADEITEVREGSWAASVAGAQALLGIAVASLDTSARKLCTMSLSSSNVV